MRVDRPTWSSNSPLCRRMSLASARIIAASADDGESSLPVATSFSPSSTSPSVAPLVAHAGTIARSEVSDRARRVGFMRPPWSKARADLRACDYAYFQATGRLIELAPDGQLAGIVAIWRPLRPALSRAPGRLVLDPRQQHHEVA